MPRNIPSVPDYTDPRFHAEKVVWEGLQNLPDDSVILSQYRIRDDRGRLREADFVVLVPGRGIAVLEVKGGQVWTAGREWFSIDHGGYEYEIQDPMLQADKAGYAIRDFVESNGGPAIEHVPVVLLPATQLPPGFTPADSDRAAWIDGLDNLPFRVLTAMQGRSVSTAEVEDLVAILEQRLPRPRAWQRAQAHQKHADLITGDQYTILRALRTNDRIMVTGGPGTGKSWLALEHARQESLRGARVALVCFNRGLAMQFQRRVSGLPADQRPARCATLHELALDVAGVDVPDAATQEFWDGVPALIDDADFERFDLVVVDEGQDFATSWWPSVRALLADPDSGPLVVFADGNQQMYGSLGLDMPVVEVQLDENVRNTAAIAHLLEVISGEPQRTRGGQGPRPFLLTSSDPLSAADAVVEQLLGTGDYRRGDIAVLTTKRRHPEQIRRLQAHGPIRFAETLIDTEQTAFSTVKGFKGLERPVVVVVVDGFHPDDDPVAIMTVGVSRATHHVVLVADPADLESRFGSGLLQACD